MDKARQKAWIEKEERIAVKERNKQDNLTDYARDLHSLSLPFSLPTLNTAAGQSLPQKKGV